MKKKFARSIFAIFAAVFTAATLPSNAQFFATDAFTNYATVNGTLEVIIDEINQIKLGLELKPGQKDELTPQEQQAKEGLTVAENACWDAFFEVIEVGTDPDYSDKSLSNVYGYLGTAIAHIETIAYVLRNTEYEARFDQLLLWCRGLYHIFVPLLERAWWPGRY